MFKRLKCWTSGHVWKDFILHARLGSYPCQVCLRCERIKAVRADSPSQT